MRLDMLLWSRMEAEFHGVLSQIMRIRTTKNEVSLLSNDDNAWRTAFSISSGSYSGLTMQELDRLSWKEFIIAPKTVSSGKAEE